MDKSIKYYAIFFIDWTVGLVHVVIKTQFCFCIASGVTVRVFSDSVSGGEFYLEHSCAF